MPKYIFSFQELQKCFESRDIGLLQETISKMPPDEASRHIKRCVDSGLWVPDAAKAEKEAAEKALLESSTAGEASSSSEGVKPNISTEDVD